MSRKAAILAVIALATAAPRQAVGTTIGYWRFEEGAANAAATGPLADSSGVSGSGTPSGGPIYRPDVPAAAVPQTAQANGLSLQFSGSSTAAFASSFVLHQAGEATFEFWLKFAPASHQAVFWTRGDSTDANRYNIHVNGDGSFGFDYRSPAGTLHPLVGVGVVIVPTDTWTHLAIVRTVSGASHIYSLYKNGALATSATDATPDLPTAASWTIGGRSGFGYVGLLDEVRASNVALSPSEFLGAAAPVPEPAALGLAGLGAAAALGRLRSHRRRA